MTNKKLRWVVATSLSSGLALSVLMMGGGACAQNSAGSSNASARNGGKGDGDTVQEIVVTGTYVRGIAPPGTNVVGISKEAVQATGVTTVAQLLQTIPQLGTFNNLQYPSGGFNQITTNRPNLRNLPGFNTSGSSSTLVLMDGHRVTGAGVSTTSPDPDIIPPSLIERVEIVPDGGSAVYGSDAVAGVVNFITKKSFSGVETDARYGGGDHYHTFDASVTAGKDWNSGSGYIAYNHSEHTELYARNRSWAQQYPNDLSGFPTPVKGIECSPGNVQLVAAPFSRGNPLIGKFFALPYTTGSAVPNTVNQCDPTKATSLYPGEDRNSFFAGVSQRFSNAIRVDVRSFFTQRVQSQDLGTFLTEEFVGPAAFGLTPSPFLASHSITGVSIPGIGVPEVQGIDLTFGREIVHTQLRTWGVAPTLTADLGLGWQLRALASYSYSATHSTTTQPNSTAIAAATAAGLFNPYDPASSNPAGLAALNNWHDFGDTRQHQIDTRVVLDGDLLTLPGGPVKFAGGLEYTSDTFTTAQGATVPGFEYSGFPGLSIGGAQIIPATAPVPQASLHREVKSVFGEAVIPIVGGGNAFPGVQQLTVSLAGRIDEYSDVGTTSNPKFGITYKPLDWIKLRASWGTSFVAPSLADTPQTSVTSFNTVQGLSFLLPPKSLQQPNGPYPVPGNQSVAVVLGNSPGLTPETSKTMSVGFDIQPPVAPGLNLSLTYFKIDFNNLISLPPFINQNEFWTSFGSVIHTNPSQALVNSYLAQSTTIVGTPAAASGYYAILDARKRNLGNYYLDGLDLSVSYTHPTFFGSVNFDFNLDYELNRNEQPIAGAPWTKLLDGQVGFSPFRFTTGVGANVGDHLSGRLTWNHNQGYKLALPVGPASAPQTSIDSFDVFNLFLQYDFKGAHIYDKDLTMTLNVDNIADQAPPKFEQPVIVPNQNGYINGATLGRIVSFGIKKKF